MRVYVSVCVRGEKITKFDFKGEGTNKLFFSSLTSPIPMIEYSVCRYIINERFQCYIKAPLKHIWNFASSELPHVVDLGCGCNLCHG